MLVLSGQACWQNQPTYGLNTLKIKLDQTTADAGNAVHCSTCIHDPFVRSLYSYIEVFLG
jgi:hypothetical protein